LGTTQPINVVPIEPRHEGKQTPQSLAASYAKQPGVVVASLVVIPDNATLVPVQTRHPAPQRDWALDSSIAPENEPEHAATLGSLVGSRPSRVPSAQGLAAAVSPTVPPRAPTLPLPLEFVGDGLTLDGG